MIHFLESPKEQHLFVIFFDFTNISAVTFYQFNVSLRWMKVSISFKKKKKRRITEPNLLTPNGSVLSAKILSYLALHDNESERKVKGRHLFCHQPFLICDFGRPLKEKDEISAKTVKML